MKLKDHPGCKRLAIVVSGAACAVAYIVLVFAWTDRGTDVGREQVLFLPLLCFVVGVATFAVIRAVYRMIDGFRKED